MKSVLAAEPAELIHLKSVRVILLVFLCVVISLLALAANQSDLDSCFISHFVRHLPLNFLLDLAICVPPSESGVMSNVGASCGHNKKDLHNRGRVIISPLDERVKSFFAFF